MHFAEKVVFDENGEARIVKTIQNGIAVNRKVSAWIVGLDARFDILLQTNRPQRMHWENVSANERFGGMVALRWGATTLEVRIKSTTPNATAIVHMEG